MQHRPGRRSTCSGHHTCCFFPCRVFPVLRWLCRRRCFFRYQRIFDYFNYFGRSAKRRVQPFEILRKARKTNFASTIFCYWNIFCIRMVLDVP